MKDYFDTLPPEISEYFEVLSGGDLPDFLSDYVRTPEMQRINGVGLNCGTDFTHIFEDTYYYTRLDHSVGTALIIWHFTKSKIQTLAGLFHDIATPCFSHCIDFLHGDYLEQESTESETERIITSSLEIGKLLARDGIRISDVSDYKLYPIADNTSPRLSADRLEYTLSSSINFTHARTLRETAEIYSDISVMKNEDGEDEIGFSSLRLAEEFVLGAFPMWMVYQSSRDKLVMQFIADTLRLLISRGKLSEKDLCTVPEDEIVSLIENCGIDGIEKTFERFRKARKICDGEECPDKYHVSLNVKKRFIDPLCSGRRTSSVSPAAGKAIEELLAYRSPTYAWFDFPVDEIYT